MEIGGYFGLELNEDNSYHKNAIRLNSGRNCLRVLIRNRRIKRLYLPYYICDAVLEACLLEDCKIVNYYLGESLRLKNEIEDFDLRTDYLYVVNYAGLLTSKEVLNYQKQYKNIILDNSQAFFTHQISDIDTIYSCRKFFGVPDGAYLYTSAHITEQYTQDYSYDRMTHILGRFELGAEKFYENYLRNEETFSSMPIRYMSRLTDNMLRSINYRRSMIQRSNNYCLLSQKLNQFNQLKLPEKVKGAFAYPLLVENADEIRRRLLEEKIFIPRYWREVLDRVSEDTIEYQYAKNILWLPCDQRYTESDMGYISDTIERVLNL